MENIKDCESWYGGNLFTLRLRGSGTFVKQAVETLDFDFNEPKFGYNGEEYDEYENES